MTFMRQLVIGSLAVFVLTACSSNSAQRRQAKNDFSYLETTELKEWVFPQNTKSQFYLNYEIPKGDYKGEVGKQVDIRPPMQILELIPGAVVERKDGDVNLWLTSIDHVNDVWNAALKSLNERGVNVLSRMDNQLKTDWVPWSFKDEDETLESRYLLSRVATENRQGINIKLTDWREDGKVVPISKTNKQRYTALMTNLITTRYDHDVREDAARKAAVLVKRIPMSMGADRSGFPVIIARTPHSVLWQRLPTLLPKMGFTIEDRNQSQGIVRAKYAEPNDAFWQDIGVKPMNLKSGIYTFVLGDLGNRTSINVTNSAGKPVEEALLSDMIPVLAAMADKY